MAKDLTYTNGVVAVKELSLLGGKIAKFAEASAEEAFQAVVASGFGKGAEVSSVAGYEALLAADARDTDAFILEYAPTRAEREYLLSPRDFHNAKALFKARAAGVSAEPLLAPDGIHTVSEIEECMKAEDFSPLGDALKGACEEAFALPEGQRTGAEIGLIFERALFAHLARETKHGGLLKSFAARRADMTNLLTAYRAEDFASARRAFVGGGKLKEEDFALFFENAEKAKEVFARAGYGTFSEACDEAKGAGMPYTQAERMLEMLEIDYLATHRYEMKRTQPFLYYVFRRRADNVNVRILLVCLAAGMDEREIKRRFRTLI
jgi:vacuolar-type H+-ATPase subunit C/Vma6